MTNCVIGLGFIGSRLANSIANAGLSVKAISRGSSPLHLSEKVEWIRGDACDAATMERALMGVTTLYHAFSSTVPGNAQKNPLYDLNENVAVTLSLLQSCVSAGVKKVVFISSGGTVYGMPESLPLSEDCALRPISIYGAGKLAIENYLRCWNWNYGLDYKIVRLSNPYGPGQSMDRNQGAINVFSAHAQANKVLSVWGDGSIIRDYIYIDDAVAGIRSVGEYGGEHNIFNIGSGKGTDINEIIKNIETCLMRKVVVEYQADRKFDVPANILGIERALKELKWAPKIELLDGIRSTIQWIAGRK